MVCCEYTAASELGGGEGGGPGESETRFAGWSSIVILPEDITHSQPTTTKQRQGDTRDGW